jgi:hypothetical protein
MLYIIFIFISFWNLVHWFDFRLGSGYMDSGQNTAHGCRIKNSSSFLCVISVSLDLHIATWSYFFLDTETQQSRFLVWWLKEIPVSETSSQIKLGGCMISTKIAALLIYHCHEILHLRNRTKRNKYFWNAIVIASTGFDCKAICTSLVLLKCG